MTFSPPCSINNFTTIYCFCFILVAIAAMVDVNYMLPDVAFFQA